MTDAPADAGAADLFRAERFLIREARLLDTRDHSGWLDTLHDDIDYVVFNRATPELRPRTAGTVADEFQPAGGLQFAEESKESLTYKVGRIDSGLTFSEIPAGRTVRLVTNIEAALDPASGGLAVESCLHCNRTRKEDRVENYYARRKDVLVDEGGRLRLLRRHVFLNETLLSASTLAIFF